MTQPCLDLREAFGGRFRIRSSEDHLPQAAIDPWNLMIPCSRWKPAFVYPYGGQTLGAWITTHYVKTALDLLMAAGAKPHQVGDGEATVLFDVADAKAVFKVLRAIRKRAGRSAEALDAIRPQKAA